MKGSRPIGVGVGVALAAFASCYLGLPSTPPPPHSVRASTIKLDDRPYELRFKLVDMLQREPPPEFMSDELRLREALDLAEDATETTRLKAALAALVLESGYSSRPPDTDALEEGRQLIDSVATRLGERSSQLLKLRTLLLLAEGKAEAALGFASQLQEVIDGKRWEGEKKGKDQKFAQGIAETDDAEAIWTAYNVQAQTLLAATCEKACRARTLELLSKHAAEGAVFKEDPLKQASSERAGAMWRIMEAGRVYERAYKAAPTANSTWSALDCHFATNRLRSLNAFQVSSTPKLFALASCDAYVGVKLGGKTCLAEDDNPYDKIKERRRKSKRRKGGDK